MMRATGSTHLLLITLSMLGILLIIPQASGTRCFRCDHFDVVEDSNFFVKAALNLLSNVFHPACKMEADSDKYNVDIVECPKTADSGMEYVCATVRGRVTTSILSIDVYWNTIDRSCVQVTKGDPAYQGCKDEDTVSPPVKYMLQRAAEGIDAISLDSDVRFNGNVCYDRKVEAIPDRSDQMQCVTCSRNEVESSTQGLSQVLEIFSKFSNDACLLENPDDTYQVGSRICPHPARGNNVACGVISGEATTSKFGIDFKYKTLERGCIEQPNTKSQSGCTNELPPDGTAEKLLKQGLDTLTLDVKFSGYICYSDTGFGKVVNDQLVSKANSNRHASFWVFGICSLVLALIRGT